MHKLTAFNGLEMSDGISLNGSVWDTQKCGEPTKVCGAEPHHLNTIMPPDTASFPAAVNPPSPQLHILVQLMQKCNASAPTPPEPILSG